MSTRPKADGNFVAEQAARMKEIIQSRAWLAPDDLEYVAETLDKLKDERFKACVAELIGWGDDERSELESFIAIAIEVMRKTTTSRLREATQVVWLRELVKPL